MNKKLASAGLLAIGLGVVFATLRPDPVQDLESRRKTGCGNSVCESGEAYTDGAGWCPTDCQPAITQQRPLFRVRRADTSELGAITGVGGAGSGEGPFSGSSTMANWAVESEGAGFWKISITANVDLSQTYFFWWQAGGSNVVPVNAPASDDRVYMPFLGGVAEQELTRSSFEWGPIAGDTGKYPGGSWGTFVVIADADYSQIFADVTYPRRKGIQAMHAREQVALLDPVLMPAGETRTYRVLLWKDRGNATFPPWILSLERYRKWVHTRERAPEIPEWAALADGFVYQGLSNATNWSSSSWQTKFDASKARFPWMQIWGQSSTYSGDPNLAVPTPEGFEHASFETTDHVFTQKPFNVYVRKTGASIKTLQYQLVGDPTVYSVGFASNGWLFEQGSPVAVDRILAKTGVALPVSSATGIREFTGCCLYANYNHGTYTPPFVHPRYTGLEAFVRVNVDAGYHVGFYTRPHPSTPEFDTPEGQAWIGNWWAQNRAIGADAQYVDVFARSYYGGQSAAAVRDWFNANPEPVITEGFVDVYPTLSLWDGFNCQNASYAGELTDQNPETCSTKCLAPEVARVALGGRLGFLGGLNDEGDCAGPEDGHKSERKAFLLGLKQIIIGGLEYAIHGQIHGLRAGVNWWARRPRYVHTLGLGTQPSGIRVRRHIDKDGVSLLTIDNPSATAGQSITLFGATIAIPSTTLSIVEVQ